MASLLSRQLPRQTRPLSSSSLLNLEQTLRRISISTTNNNHIIGPSLHIRSSNVVSSSSHRPSTPAQWIHTSTVKYQSNTDNSSSSLPPPREIYNYTEDIQGMTNEQLSDPFTIPGFATLIHTPPRDRATTPRNALVGKVVSDKMQKTVNVQVDRYKIVPKYKKRMKYSKKFMAHDEEEVCQEGDVVMIVPCQRLSRKKHFRVHEIIKKGHVLKSMES